MQAPPRAEPAAGSLLRVELIRHGRTAWNVQRRFLGSTDIPLDEEGRAEAALLPSALGPVHAIWSSPLLRAWETASALGQPHAHPGLAELHMGALEGLDAPTALERYPHVLAGWQRDPSGVEIPDGETMAQLQARCRAAFDTIVADPLPPGVPHPGAPLRIAIVTHQLAIASLLCSLADRPLTDFRRFTHRNTAWTSLDVRDGRATIVAVDQGPHLG